MCHFELIPFRWVPRNDSKNIADNLQYIHVKPVDCSFLIWYEYLLFPVINKT